MAGIADSFFAFFGLDVGQQRALLGLRLRLMRRQFQREPGKMAGFLAFLIFFGPLVIVLAIVSAYAYLELPGTWPAQVMGIVLCLLWLAWIILPVFAFRTNEGLDLARLLIFPLSRRDLVASALIGTLLDGPSYVTLPFFVAMIVGWIGTPWQLLVLVPAIVMAYCMMMASGQLVLTTSTGLLRSRRFRDLTIVLLSLLGSSCYVVNRGIEAWLRAADTSGLEGLEPLLYLRWLPPGACAQAVASAGAGNWGEALLWLGYAGAWLAVLLWAWWKVLERMTTGASAWNLPLPEAKKASRPRTRLSDRVAAIGFGWLPAPARASMVKELKLIWRVPQRRIGLLQSILAPFVLIFAVFFGDMSALRRLPEWTAMGLPAIILFAAWGLSSNMLGMESRGLGTLILTPAPRWQIFTGKGIAYGLVALIPTTFYAAILGYTARSPLIIFGMIAAAGTALTVIGVNMIACIYITFPFDESVTTRQRSGGSCSTGLAQVILLPIAMAIAGLPTTLPMAAGIWFNLPALIPIGAFGGIAYAITLFVWATRYAGRLLTEREPEVLMAARLER